MIAVREPQDPGWPWNVKPIVMPVEIVLAHLAAVPQEVESLLETILAGYPERTVGALPEDIADAATTLLDVAHDFGQLAQQRYEALSPEDRAEAWKTTKLRRRAEARQKQEVPQ